MNERRSPSEAVVIVGSNRFARYAEPWACVKPRVHLHDGGTISSGGVAAAYYPLRNLGFGLGIEDTSITIREYRGDDYVARGNYDQLAGVAFLALAF